MSNRIRIKFGQIEFEAEGDSELIERERQQFISLLPQAVATISPIISKQEENRKMKIIDEHYGENPILNSTEYSKGQTYESLAALFKDKSFNTDIDKIMGVAYYLDQIKGMSPFNFKDIEEALVEARQQKPTNISDCINKNIGKSYIIPLKEKKDGQKAFRISSSGVEWLEKYISVEKKDKRSSTKKRTSKSVEISKYNSITREELNLHKYPSVKQLANFKEKMLIVMHIITRENKGEYFTIFDIMFIMTNIFGEKATRNQVSGVFNRNPDWFNKISDESNSKVMKYKMLNGAIEFVSNILEQKSGE